MRMFLIQMQPKHQASSAFQIGLAVTVAGLILIAVAAGIDLFLPQELENDGEAAEDDEEE